MNPMTRTSGERAFDRSVVGILVWAIGAFVSLLAFATPAISLQVASLIAGVWSLLILGYLCWCLTDVVRAWNDPSARVLRFSAIGLLLLLAVASIALTLTPALLPSGSDESAEIESTD